MALRIATFNAALSRNRRGRLATDLQRGDHQARAVARILRRVRPDILLLNELDFDPRGTALSRFRRHYLLDGSLPEPPLRLPHGFTAPVNTGLPSGLDLDGDGRTDGPGDALGFGRFAGQYGMAMLSRAPLAAPVRSFRRLLWRDMPGAALPRDPHTHACWYPPRALAVLPVSSKSHWVVTVQIDGHALRLLASHPTPPAFDGPERRNHWRNRAELQLWRDYLDAADYLVDDCGQRGGRDGPTPVVLLGDLNADPADGNGDAAAINALIRHPALQDPAPRSRGGAERPAAGAGDPGLHTLVHDDFALRTDYVLPDRHFEILDAGVYWPAAGEPGRELVGDGTRVVSSDHRLVWVDLKWPP